MTTPTPTESYIGFDGNGVPSDDSTRIIAPGKLLPPVPVLEAGFSGGVRQAFDPDQLAKANHAMALRSSGHHSPAVSPRDLDELDKQLEPLRTHRCRGCACALRPEQPCGSYCGRCGEELVELERACARAWWSLPAWVLVAALAALGLAEVVVGVAWWWGK